MVSEGDRGRREVHTNSWLTSDNHATARTIRIFLIPPESRVSNFVLFADQKNDLVVEKVVSETQIFDLFLCEILEIAVRHRLQ